MHIRDLLSAQPADATVLAAPGREPLNYGGLGDVVDRAGERLAGLGIGAGDKVAIVLPNGPEMAAAFLAVACHATAAPLNPAYRQEEFAYYLKDLNARALIAEEGADSSAVAAAKDLGVPVITLAVPDGAPAGTIALGGNGATGRADAARDPENVALVLHTSGTTSRPKIVPLTHANLVTSAGSIAETLDLKSEDRCLNIMPLFHIHGLVAAILASLRTGGSVFCSPGFNALKFFSWLEEARPSWYSGVPTMHQALLSRAGRNRASIEANPLRFIRSSSASLPEPVFTALEEAFGCPVIEAYSMTEAAHQMTSNQLPPGTRKPGTVGVAAGPEVRIMGEMGRLLEPGGTGEVVIRGANVTNGYENNPAANEIAFAHGWFHTGDQGVMDADGFLTITGRLKEIINRGGEKVAPLEIDAVLMGHPAVHQAVSFAMPHDKLGEEVAVAIVLKEGQTATEREIRDFAAEHLADFKVPRKVIILDDIPKGPTGKLQRIGLAEKLGLSA